MGTNSQGLGQSLTTADRLNLNNTDLLGYKSLATNAKLKVIPKQWAWEANRANDYNFGPDNEYGNDNGAPDSMVSYNKQNDIGTEHWWNSDMSGQNNAYMKNGQIMNSSGNPMNATEFNDWGQSRPKLASEAGSTGIKFDSNGNQISRGVTPGSGITMGDALNVVNAASGIESMYFANGTFNKANKVADKQIQLYGQEIKNNDYQMARQEKVAAAANSAFGNA